MLNIPQITLLSKNRNMFWAFVGMLISRLGDGVYSVAVIALAYGITQSGAGTGIVLAAFALSSFLFGSLSGVASDRWNRKMLLISSSLLCSGVVITMAVLSYSGTLNVTSLTILSFLLGAATQFFEPIVNALIPRFVTKDELTTANATIGMTDSLGYIAGPAAAAVLLAWLPMEVVLLINAASFLFASLAASFLHIPQISKTERKQTSVFTEAVEGFTFVYQTKRIRQLFIISCLSLLAYSPFFVLLPLFLDQDLLLSAERQSAVIGMIYSSLALGQLAGYAVVSYLRLSTYKLLGIGYLLQAIGFGCLIFVHEELWIVFFIFIAGISFGLTGSAFHTNLQSNTPDDRLGRVYGVNYTVSGLIAPIGRSSSGILADALGAKVMFSGMTFLFLVSSAMSFWQTKEKATAHEENNHLPL